MNSGLGSKRRHRAESGRFVPMDVSYPDDSYPKLR